jgi:glycosyltransferase involved in cell wall biosynthesis
MYLLNIYYQEWIRRYDTFSDVDLHGIEEEIFHMAKKPFVSIIMPVYNPPIKFLEEAIESVLKQMYPFWQLCIADDASTDDEVKNLIKYYQEKDARIDAIFRKTNGHISAASNSAMTLAIHDYIALLDHDDILNPLALYYVAKTINAHPDSEIIFSDEDKITKWGRRFDPYFKPEFNYELLLSQNMVSHLGVYRTETIRKIQGFREGLEGSQDYDLVLRILEKSDPNQIHHIPRPLYHWRVSNRSVAEDVNIKPYATIAGSKALEEHLTRKSIQGKVEFLPDLAAYQVDYTLVEPKPSTTILIPAEEFSNEIINCINQIISQTDYSNYDIHLVLPCHQKEISIKTPASWEDVVQIKYGESQNDVPNIDSINQSIASDNSDYVAILCDPLIGFSPDWLRTLVSHATQPNIGIVAPKLIYQNGFVHSNGVILLPDVLAQNLSEGAETDDIGYFGWAKLQRSFSAVSEKCFLVKRQHFEMVGGLSEDFKTKMLAMIDLCLKLREQGFRNVLCPSIELSLQEDYGKRNTNKTLNEADKRLIEQRWLSWIENDPAFNPNLSIGDDGKILINLTPRIRV